MLDIAGGILIALFVWFIALPFALELLVAICNGIGVFFDKVLMLAKWLLRVAPYFLGALVFIAVGNSTDLPTESKIFAILITIILLSVCLYPHTAQIRARFKKLVHRKSQQPYNSVEPDPELLNTLPVEIEAASEPEIFEPPFTGVRVRENNGLKQEEYLLDGKLHRDDGPARIITTPDGKVWEEHWIDGVPVPVQVASRPWLNA